MKNEGRQVMDQRSQEKRDVVRNEKWPRDMHRELSIIALCPPIRHGYTSKQPTLPHKAYGAELC